MINLGKLLRMGVNGYCLVTDSYRPYLNYKWNTITENGVRYLQDSGTTPKLHGEMFTGRGLQFDSALSQSVIANKLNVLDINTGFTISLDITGDSVRTNLPLLWFGRYDITIFDGRVNIYNGVSHNYFHNWTGYYKLTIVCDSISTFVYKNYELVHTFEGIIPNYVNQVLEIGGRTAYGNTTDKLLSNLIILNQVLTPAQIQAQYNNPESFLYRDSNGDLQSDTIDTNNVVSWFPMIDRDGYVRDNANYSEGGASSQSNSVAGFFNLNSTEETLIFNSMTRTTEWITLSLGSGKLFIDSNGVASRSRYQYKVDGTIFFGGGDYLPDGLIEIPSNATQFRLYYSNVGTIDIAITELSGIYLINNYTEQMNVSQLNTGLQTSKLLIENNVVSGLATGIKGHGDGYVKTQRISLPTYFAFELVFTRTPTSSSAWEWLMYCGEDGGNAPLVIATQANKMRCSLGSWFSDMFTSTTKVLNDGLNHVLVGRDENNNCFCFVNGVSDGVSQNRPTVIEGLSLKLLQMNDNNVYIGEFTKSEIHTEPQDPVELYNKAVSQGLLND